MQSREYLIAVTLAVGLAGCSGYLPAGFVKADADYGYRLRAVSAGGSALTLRTEENPENGDLGFWEKAINTRLAEVRGYQPAGRTEVKIGSTPGVELLYSYSRDGIDYQYMVTLAVRGRSVHVFEAAGPAQELGAELPEIRKSVATWPL